MKKGIKAAAIISYITVILNTVAGLLLTPWIVRTIGKSSYGLYTTALSIIALFMMDFGLGSAVSKFLSDMYLSKDYDSAHAFTLKIYKIFGVITVILAVVFIIVFLNIKNIYTQFTSSEMQTFEIVFAIVAFYSLFSFPFTPQNGTLIAREQFFALKLCGLLNKVLTLVLTVLSLLLGWGVYGLVASNALSNVLFVIVKIYIISLDSKYHTRSEAKTASIPTKRIIAFSSWVTVSQLAQRFIFNIVPTILSMQSGTGAIAVFGIAASIEGYVYTIADSINGLLLPRVTKLSVQIDSKEKLTDLMIRVGRIQLFIFGLIFCELIVIGRSFISVWMGQGYEEVYICAVLLIVPGLFEHPSQIGRTAVVATNKVKYQSYIYIVMAAANVILSYVLSRVWGVTGAAFSIMLVYFFRTFWMLRLYSKKIGIQIGRFLVSTYRIALPIMLLIVIVAKLVLSLFSTSLILRILIGGTVVLLLYALLFYKFVMSIDEKNMLKGIRL